MSCRVVSAPAPTPSTPAQKPAPGVCATIFYFRAPSVHVEDVISLFGSWEKKWQQRPQWLTDCTYVVIHNSLFYILINSLNTISVWTCKHYVIHLQYETNVLSFSQIPLGSCMCMRFCANASYMHLTPPPSLLACLYNNFPNCQPHNPLWRVAIYIWNHQGG